MKIDVRCRGIEAADSLKVYAARRVHSHLSRFGHEIGSVLVRISDVNGPRGGLDKQCQITVRGHRLGRVVIAHLSADAYAAVDVAAERIDQARRSQPRTYPRRPRGSSRSAVAPTKYYRGVVD